MYYGWDIAHAIGEIVSCVLHGKMVGLGINTMGTYVGRGYLPMRRGNTVVPKLSVCIPTGAIMHGWMAGGVIGWDLLAMSSKTPPSHPKTTR